jgi:hypothetical protein
MDVKSRAVEAEPLAASDHRKSQWISTMNGSGTGDPRRVILGVAQQVRQLRHVGRDPLRLIFRQQFSRRLPLLPAHATEGVAIPSGPTKLMRGSEGICHTAAYAHFFD